MCLRRQRGEGKIFIWIALFHTVWVNVVVFSGDFLINFGKLFGLFKRIKRVRAKTAKAIFVIKSLFGGVPKGSVLAIPLGGYIQAFFEMVLFLPLCRGCHSFFPRVFFLSFRCHFVEQNLVKLIVLLKKIRAEQK